MKAWKALTGAAIGCASILAMAIPASGQSVRAQRGTPAPQPGQALVAPQAADHEQIKCDRQLALFYTVRGIVIYCSSYEFGTRYLAVDHTKFPGGMNALVPFLIRAQEAVKSKDGTNFWVYYRAPTPKARALCTIAAKGNKNAPPCQEVVSFSL